MFCSTRAIELGTRNFSHFAGKSLALCRRGGRKRAIGTSLAPNDRWSLGFVSDQLTESKSCTRLVFAATLMWVPPWAGQQITDLRDEIVTCRRPGSAR